MTNLKVRKSYILFLSPQNIFVKLHAVKISYNGFDCRVIGICGRKTVIVLCHYV